MQRKHFGFALSHFTWRALHTHWFGTTKPAEKLDCSSKANLDVIHPVLTLVCRLALCFVSQQVFVEQLKIHVHGRRLINSTAFTLWKWRNEWTYFTFKRYFCLATWIGSLGSKITRGIAENGGRWLSQVENEISISALLTVLAGLFGSRWLDHCHEHFASRLLYFESGRALRVTEVLVSPQLFWGSSRPSKTETECHAAPGERKFSKINGLHLMKPPSAYIGSHSKEH